MKINLSKCEGFSTHRSGWGYAIKSLTPFHAKNGIFFDDFVERKFIWNADKDKSHYDFPWIGTVHLPYHDRTEFGIKNSLQFLCSQENFKKSLKKCLCLVVLSEDLKKQVSSYLKDYQIPIIVVKYPAEKSIEWNPLKFLKNPSITKLGYWLRDFTKFNEDIKSLKKINTNFKTYCMPGHVYEYHKIWSNIINLKGYIEYHDPINLNSQEFDNHLSQTLVWCWFHYTAANTAIVESMIRNVPIFTNRLPSVVEYLGEDYPLYGNENLIDENGLVRTEKILEAYEHIKKIDKTILSGEYFAYDLITKLEKVI